MGTSFKVPMLTDKFLYSLGFFHNLGWLSRRKYQIPILKSTYVETTNIMRSACEMFCKALFPPRFLKIFQYAKISQQKLMKNLIEFLGGAGILYQNIPTKISIIFVSKFLQSGRYKKFSVEHTLFVKMCLYTRKDKLRLVFLTKVSKTTAAKQTVRPAK